MKDPRSLRVLPLCALLLAPMPLAAQQAPGGPGELPTWSNAAKDGIGTSLSTDSKVWFTLEGGTLTEVYYPRVDMADVRALEFAVSDGRHVWFASHDMRHTIEQIDDAALLFRQTSRDPRGRFTLTKTYATDPAHNTLLIDVTFDGPPGDAVYVLYHPALANSGYGNSGATQNGALVAWKDSVASALMASGQFSESSSGFAGVNDGYTDLALHHALRWHFTRADSGNVVQAARVRHAAHFTLALGFGATPDDAVDAARRSLARGFPTVRAAYAREWHDYVRRLAPVDSEYANEAHLAAMVIRANEDKTYRGAIIASMSIPWGYAVPSDKTDVGGYHLVWARDLYEAATALMVAGDSATARRALHYLFDVQQKSDGSYPQNSWLDGRPYWPSVQMDEISYPAVLAWQLGLTDRATWEQHIRPAAEYVMTHGPATPQERWEEEGGYSPSTMAAEIAGLVCASSIAKTNGDTAAAIRYLATADDWAAHLEPWLVTTTGHLAGSGGGGYYIRIDNNEDPNDGFKLDINNGGGSWDERDVVDQGFIELVRLGIRPATDPTIMHSLAIIDSTIRVETPNGPAFYRYNHDGYGETYWGGPWQGTGVGRLWPIFAGERGEYEIARGASPRSYLRAMLGFANDGGMIAEQVWDRANPGRADLFRFGQGTGSATPLVWSMGQFLRLAVDAHAGRVLERPSIVAEHFLQDGAR